MNLIIATAAERTRTQFANEVNELTDKLERARYCANRMQMEMKNFESYVPKLEDALKSLGLQIYDLQFRKSHMINPGEMHWGEDHKLTIDIEATPISKTSFTYINFKGYDRNGCGKNDKQLVAKANKISEAIQLALGYVSSVNVNKYSLEGPRESKCGVMISIIC